MSLMAKSVFMTHARIEFSKKIILITSKQLSEKPVNNILRIQRELQSMNYNCMI